MCSNMRSISSTDKPDASGWEHAVRHFLGYHMIRAFDVLNFLEDTGTFPPRILSGSGRSGNLKRFVLLWESRMLA